MSQHVKTSAAERHVTRAEFDASAAVEECSRNGEIQFQRIAPIQKELDAIRGAWVKASKSRTEEFGVRRKAR